MTEVPHIAFQDLTQSLQKHKDRVAIISRDGSLCTYNQLRDLIVGAQIELKKRGVKKGSKVLVFVPMSVELYASLEAIFSLGATAIFLDPWMGGRKISKVIRLIKPNLFLVTKSINRITRLLPATWFLKKWILTEIQPSKEEWKIERVEDNDNALITFTSGTSGNPKGANRTFGFLYAQLCVLKSHLKNESTEFYIDFTNFPIVGLADFAMGNTVVIPDVNLMKIHEADSNLIAQQLSNSGTNRIIVSPSLLSRIIAAKNNVNLKEIVTGGAPISNTLINNCRTKFPNAKLEAIYGSTESEPICITDFERIISHLELPLNGIYVGKPVDSVHLKIIKIKQGPVTTAEFVGMELKETTIGEVVVTGNHVNKNYYENQEAFRKGKIVDESGEIWHRTGDLGYLKNDELFLVGRDHRIMKVEGKFFYPYPIEQFIEQKFDLTDIGYVQNKKGKFILFVGISKRLDFLKIISAVRGVGYPIDEIKVLKKALPRDARHKSKLQVEDLI